MSLNSHLDGRLSYQSVQRGAAEAGDDHPNRRLRNESMVRRHAGICWIAAAAHFRFVIPAVAISVRISWIGAGSQLRYVLQAIAVGIFLAVINEIIVGIASCRIVTKRQFPLC